MESRNVQQCLQEQEFERAFIMFLYNTTGEKEVENWVGGGWAE